MAIEFKLTTIDPQGVRGTCWVKHGDLPVVTAWLAEHGYIIREVERV